MVVGDSAIFCMVIRGSVLVFERGRWGCEIGMSWEIRRECVVILRVRFVVLKVSWGEKVGRKVDKYGEKREFGSRGLSF